MRQRKDNVTPVLFLYKVHRKKVHKGNNDGVRSRHAMLWTSMLHGEYAHKYAHKYTLQQ